VSLLDPLKDLPKLLIPPKPHDIHALLRWQWAIAASVIGLSAALLVHVALACGFVPSVFAGFASSEQMTKIESEISMITVLNLSQEMREDQMERCKTKDDDMKFKLSGDLDRMELYYTRMTHTAYALPACGDL